MLTKHQQSTERARRAAFLPRPDFALPALLRRRLLDFANHLLLSEDWALARLRPFAGATFQIACGSLTADFDVAIDGSLLPGSGRPAVSVRLPADTLRRLLTDRSSIAGSVQISGSAELAEALAGVARHLSWDVEADLASLIGEIPAHRGVQIGRALFAAARSRLAAAPLPGVAAMLVKRDEATRLDAEIAAFAADLQRLERR